MADGDAFCCAHRRLQAPNGHLERLTSKQPEVWAVGRSGEAWEILKGLSKGPGASSTFTSANVA